MDRLNIDQAAIDQKRAEYLAEEGDPLDRRHRCVTHGPEFLAMYQDADGAWQPSRLRENDHVLLDDTQSGIVLCPAQLRDTFFVWLPESMFGAYAAPYRLENIVDRAPADPAETPMPLIPPAEEEPPTEGEPPPPEAPPDEPPPAPIEPGGGNEPEEPTEGGAP